MDQYLAQTIVVIIIIGLFLVLWDDLPGPPSPA